MSDLLGLIRQVDVSIYYFLNGFAGNRVLDYICKFAEYSKFFRGGVLTAVYWFFWFQPDARQQRRRRAIVTIVAGALLSLIASRLIADVLPFRTRPMYDLHLQHQPYSVPIQPDLVNWSAFPSDQATFFFALAFGMLYLSRWVGFLAMFYAAVWICLPRMFLGVHYASDTLAGAAIGMVTVWASIRARWLQSNVAAPLLAFAEARPGSFYLTAFLCSFEMAALFDDVRAAGGTVLRIFQIDPRHWPSLGAIAGASALVFLAIASEVCPETGRNDANAGSSGDVSNPRSLTVSATINVEMIPSSHAPRPVCGGCHRSNGRTVPRNRYSQVPEPCQGEQIEKGTPLRAGYSAKPTRQRT